VKPEHCRTVEILADAAALVLQSPASESGRFYIDDELLAANGISDLGKYSLVPGSKQLMPDLFL
ncbi:MAG: SDR family oxidoreductase, partial [Burkholderiaceae bacterium]